MDPFMRLLIMMRRLAQRRISQREFVVLMVVLAVCVAAGLFEYVFGWPEALTVERPRIHRTPLFR